MVNIDIYDNPKDFSIFARVKILSRTEKALNLSKEDNQEEAIQIYTNLIEMIEWQEDIYVNRGIAFYEIWEKDLAIADFKKAILLNPTNSLALSFLGEILQEKD